MGNSKTGEIVLNMDDDKGNGVVLGVAFSPDGKRIASGHMGYVRVWDAQTGQLLVSLPAHLPGRLIATVGFSSDGRKLFSGGGNGTVYIWDSTRTEAVR